MSQGIRIIGGRWRGRLITVPPQSTRPTSNRLRETLFNILQHDPSLSQFMTECQVADIFCGSGALGFEALSRGATFLTALDLSPEAHKTIVRTAEMFGVRDKVRAVCGDALRPKPADRAHNLVFIDPPYGKNLARPALAALWAARWIQPGAVVVIETEKDAAITEKDTIGSGGVWRPHRRVDVGPASVMIGWVDKMETQ